MFQLALRAGCGLFISFTALVGSAEAANPMGVAYKSTTNVALYGKPTGMVVTGRCNRNDAAFAEVRRKGGEVLAYIIPSTRPDHYVCALDEGFFMNDRGAVPLWPYPTYGQRSNRANTRFTDMRPGSRWILHVVAYVERLMREGKVDGVFLDQIGARPWGQLAEYGSWSTAEKNAWTNGNVDLVRRLDAKRRAIRPGFIIVNNNIWDRGGSGGLTGERYVDGIMLEQPQGFSKYHTNYVKKPFSNLGHRRMIVLTNTREEALRWAKIPGVTHVGAQRDSQFAYPPVPVIPFHR
ncbi:MAG: hypothetical protein ACREV5_18980 [Steroidobacter sp.]